ncbi:MAG TPA: hypothetical protein VM032_09505 [Vicinamibacterales bacterium]|nr:hypothetical protein [Vicinamibacterales bacterium]
MRLLVYISGHGFGHAARSAELINAIARHVPRLEIVLRTTVPEWFLRASLAVEARILGGDTDTGVVQQDSFSIDEDESARRAAAFYCDFDARVEREAALIRDVKPALVVADIPPVAFPAAAAAGVPSVACSNFTWDWIYSGFPGFDAIAPGVRALIARANAQATRALRLPFAGGFAGMPAIEDVPLVARRARIARAETRARLGLPSDRVVVLATFGGHAGNVNLASAAADGSFLVVATDYEVGDARAAHPNLRVVPGHALRDAGTSYTDLLGAADVVVTKLGYGIVSECLANEVALLYATRGRFIEQDVFIREMPAVMRCRAIGVSDLRAGRWAPAVHALLAQPRRAPAMRLDGADAVAVRLLDLARLS